MCIPLDIIFYGNLWSHMNFPCHVYDMVMSKKCNQMANFPGFSANSMKTNEQVRLVCFHSVCRRSWKVFWTSKSWSDVQAHFFFFYYNRDNSANVSCVPLWKSFPRESIFRIIPLSVMKIDVTDVSNTFQVFFFCAQVSRFVFWFFMHLHTI